MKKMRAEYRSSMKSKSSEEGNNHELEAEDTQDATVKEMDLPSRIIYCTRTHS